MIGAETFPPLIDLSNPAAPAQVDEACRRVGFFQILGHGIAPDLVATLFASADEFFGLDLDEKMQWKSPDARIERGYAARGTEGISYSMGVNRPPDLVESFSLGREPLPDQAPFHASEHFFFAPNIWPDRPAALRSVLLEYYQEADRVAHHINNVMARGLGLAPDFFEPFTDASTDTLRINYYKGFPGEAVLPDQFGLGAHTDYGVCTVLLGDQEPGLEVFTVEDGWRSVVPVAGALLVNVGDLLARWTNDRWRSTLHRVVPLEVTGTEVRRRRSIPFFHEGNFDAMVECLATCVGADNPPRYPPITGGDHVFARAQSARLLTASEVTSTIGDRIDALHS